MKAFFCFLFAKLLLLSFSIKAQNFINENSVFECDQAFLIDLPLKVQNDPTVFYQYEEQFSFWYRLESTTETEINVALNPIDSNDRYAVLVFESGKGDFCDQVFQQKVKPLKTQLLKQKISPSGRLTSFSLQSKEAKNYYFCVLNTSLSNCGHELTLKQNQQQTRVRAIHIPCVVPEEEKQEQQQDSLQVSSNYLTSLISLVDQSTKEKQIQAEIIIEDPEFKTTVKIDFDGIQKHPLRIERGKLYKVSCVAPGYKRFEHQLVMSEYMESDSSDFSIFLEPLQRGDKFLMSHIYFHPNTYALKKEAKKEIDYLVNFLDNNPKLNIELAGHTNGNNNIKRNRAYKNRSEQWNFKGTSKKLSILRAEEIKKKLVRKGIPKERITTVGYGGDYMLIKDARTIEAIEKNVRVEVRIS